MQFAILFIFYELVVRNLFFILVFVIFHSDRSFDKFFRGFRFGQPNIVLEYVVYYFLNSPLE